ncbi:hypothetical protein TRIUR3_32069 [Triticum urartu]|uniref:Glycosyltransferase 61 catalytic domain-containing protein n=1 Tax=Triticum urartu TaxID=4572 RepID=M8A587_TRIUA|nr:hypothetical protein TRIUR3_32069 [Triticum urartu]
MRTPTQGQEDRKEAPRGGRSNIVAEREGTTSTAVVREARASGTVTSYQLLQPRKVSDNCEMTGDDDDHGVLFNTQATVGHKSRKNMVQQHRIYVVQFDKGEPDQEELSCKASPPKGGGRRIMYYYHDYGTGGGAGKNGKPAKSRALSLSGFFGLLLICLFGLATLLAAPGAFFSFARTGGAAARGALRMHSASASFQLVSSAGRPAEEERIRPYTRKWEAHVMKTIDELPVDPARPPEGRSIRDFRRLLDDAYRPRINYLERMERKAARKQRRASGAAATKLALPNKHPAAPAERPKLVIVSRTGSRVIENEEELKAVAADVGFDVRVVRPERSTEMCKIYRDLNASDAMVGVHGAAMTHFLFMRPGKVFIQVVPLGTDWAANEYYGEPAARLGLRYVGYKILPEESSLAREYPAGHPVLTDPAGVAQRGWDVTKKVYLDRQNVRLDLARFREELVAAHRYSG